MRGRTAPRGTNGRHPSVPPCHRRARRRQRFSAHTLNGHGGTATSPASGWRLPLITPRCRAGRLVRNVASRCCISRDDMTDWGGAA